MTWPRSRARCSAASPPKTCRRAAGPGARNAARSSRGAEPHPPAYTQIARGAAYRPQPTEPARPNPGTPRKDRSRTEGVVPFGEGAQRLRGINKEETSHVQAVLHCRCCWPDWPVARWPSPIPPGPSRWSWDFLPAAAPTRWRASWPTRSARSWASPAGGQPPGRRHHAGLRACGACSARRLHAAAGQRQHLWLGPAALQERAL